MTRLHGMDAPPYLVAGGLAGVVAQRLVRRLCRHCRRPSTDRAGAPDGPGPDAGPATLYEPGGCRRCEGTGYRGRIGVFEVLPLDDRIRELVLARASAAEVRDAARASRMRTLAHDAWAKVRAGLTSLEEARPLLALLREETRLCSCGMRLRPAFRHCPGCGRELGHHCRCGASLEPGWRHCVACGAPVGREAADILARAAPPGS